MAMVLRTTRWNWNDRKKAMKWSRPIHSLPQMPSAARYFLNASCAPYIGRYWKMIR